MRLLARNPNWIRQRMQSPWPGHRVLFGQMAELRRAQSHIALEEKRKMTLIGKTADQRNLCQRSTRMRQQMGCVLHSAPPDQVAYGAAVVFVKLARKVYVVHAHFGRNFGQAQPFQKS